MQLQRNVLWHTRIDKGLSAVKAVPSFSLTVIECVDRLQVLSHLFLNVAFFLWLTDGAPVFDTAKRKRKSLSF
jgi:hypothetical protein